MTPPAATAPAGARRAAIAAVLVLGAAGALPAGCRSDGADVDERVGENRSAEPVQAIDTTDSGAIAARRREVAERGATVMPFDLDRTTHVFTPDDSGGVQTVVADDPSDAEQVRLVRAHVREEAARFRRGDFSDPAAIHGAAMPGLAELRAGAARIEVAYRDVPAGGRIRYRTADPALVRALHAWFAAQRFDHGVHAADR